ncbi:MarR family winged helix-turn-helix transcriptional regulator [Micromonospora sp. NPDC005163]
MAVLCALDRHGPMSVGELAAYEQVRPPSMTRTVTSMEKAAWVRRVPDSLDRRVTWIGLTDHGRDLVAADRQARDAWLVRQLRALEPEEREVLRRAAPILEMLSRQD